MINPLWVLAVLVVIALYIWGYYQYQTTVSILQTSASDFSFDMLREKQPIVIQDKIASLDDIQRFWFRPSIVKKMQVQGNDVWSVNRAKYLVFQPSTDGEVFLYPPKGKMVDGAPDPSETLVAIQMSSLQLLIIPFHWRFLVPREINGHCLHVHDYITYFLP